MPPEIPQGSIGLVVELPAMRPKENEFFCVLTRGALLTLLREIKNRAHAQNTEALKLTFDGVGVNLQSATRRHDG